MLRSKGFFWIAADHALAFEWAQAGGVSDIDVAGNWLAAVPREHWSQEPGQRPDEQPGWHPRFGDRAQQLVFIGQHMDEARTRAALDACLLDPAIAARDSSAWSALPNPFRGIHEGADAS